MDTTPGSDSSTLATISFLFLAGSFNIQLRRLFLSVSAMSIARVCLLDGRGQRDLFLVTILRYAASDNFNYSCGCLMLLPINGLLMGTNDFHRVIHFITVGKRARYMLGSHITAK